jgi:hypothetical protein
VLVLVLHKAGLLVDTGAIAASTSSAHAAAWKREVTKREIMKRKFHFSSGSFAEKDLVAGRNSARGTGAEK